MNPSEPLSALYRKQLLAFAERAMTVLEPATPLVVSWHHKAIAHKLEQCRRNEIRRLIVNQPPKTLKTHLVTVSHVAWLLMHDPSLKIAIICYDETLASTQLRSIRQILRSPWYSHLAGSTRIKKDKDTESLFETTAGGEVHALSVQGGITGYGFDYVIMDDPMKAGSAHSETERRRLEDLYASAIANRWRNPKKGVLILVMQRLHIDDFTQYLKRIKPDTTHLSIPAIAGRDQHFEIGPGRTHLFREGDLLEPERLSVEFLEEMRAVQGRAHYEAQYLQAPFATGGQVVNPAWFRRFSTSRKPDYTIISVDPAFTENGGNYSAALVCNLVGDDVEIVHGEMVQVDYPGIVNWIGRLDVRWKPDMFLIETLGAGIGLPAYLRERDITHFERITSGKSKLQRMEIVSPRIEAGRVWLPDAEEWPRRFLEIMADFPYGSTDDWPDALSQLLLHQDKVRRAAALHRHRRFPPPPPPQPANERRRSMYYQRFDLSW